MDEECNVMELIDNDMVKCDAPAVAIHEYGCVHEHVNRRANCAEHAPRPGMVGCWDCFQAGHSCTMAFREIILRAVLAAQDVAADVMAEAEAAGLAAVDVPEHGGDDGELAEVGADPGTRSYTSARCR